MTGRQLFALLFIIGVTAMTTSFVSNGYKETWERWGIPVMLPYFADARAITAGAESAAIGLDPLQENPADPWNRAMAYPRIWQGLFLLPLDQGHTLYLGATFIVMFLSGLALFSWRISRAGALWLVAALFSPAVLLGVERANNDLVCFFLVALFLYLLRRNAAIATVPLLAAITLKLFPLFAAFALAKSQARQSVYLFTGIIAFAALYILATFNDLLLISSNTLHGTFYAYGASVWGRFVGQPHGTEGAPLTLLSAYASIPLLAGVAWFLCRRAGPTGVPADDGYLDGLRAGMAIYAGSFLLNSNWDYRLVFLLFTIPQLASWSAHAEPLVRWLSRIMLIVLMGSLWSISMTRGIGLIWDTPRDYLAFDETLNWIVFGLSLFFITYTLPDRIKKALGCEPAAPRITPAQPHAGDL